jgi:3-oxoacyl-[acyl-carrier protein] reductase
MIQETDPYVLVTGATRGIGRAIAERVAAGGRKVLGVYRRDVVAAAATEAAIGPALRLVMADLTLADGWPRVLEALDAVLGPGGTLAGVVFNAGVVLRGAFAETAIDGVDPITAQLEGDLAAPLRICRALLREGRLGGGSSLVFVSSNLARNGLAGMVAYTAAKAGLEGATRALARELGPLQIRVNAVAPGLLRTDMTHGFGEVGYDDYAAEVPLGRVGEPADVAPAVEFLLGDGARYITGQVLDIDGGWGC